MPNQTILIVDPNPIDLKMLAAALRAESWRVQVASNGEQALMTLRTIRPDLMLVSLKLPGITGLELVNEVRQNANTCAILVVAVSPSATDEKPALAAGCDRFLAKPIDIRQLGERVRAWLNPQTVPVVPAARENTPPSPEALPLPPADVSGDP